MITVTSKPIYMPYTKIFHCYPLPGKTGKLPKVRVRAGKIVTPNFTGEIPGKEGKGEEFLQKQGKGKRVNSN